MDWVRLTPEMLLLPFWCGQHWTPLAGKAVSVSQSSLGEEAENNFFLKTLYSGTTGAGHHQDMRLTCNSPSTAERMNHWQRGQSLEVGVPNPLCPAVRVSVVSGGLRRF